MKLQNIRRQYLQGELTSEQLNVNPILQFESWLQQAVNADFPDPTVMTLATVDGDGQPSQRIVLLKQVDQEGFVFFTNKQSHKGMSMSVNHNVSLHFPWHVLERQVSVRGVVESLDVEDVERYFQSRPVESQLAAWTSQQSQVIPSREHLVERFESLKAQYAKGDIPLPNFWGGYRVIPSVIEFWQGGEHRLHDRFQYTLQGDKTWLIHRLAP